MFNSHKRTKFNDSSILITIISCDYLNLSLADEHVGDVTISTQVIEYSQIFFRWINQSDCSIQIKLNYIYNVIFKGCRSLMFNLFSLFWCLFSFFLGNGGGVGGCQCDKGFWWYNTMEMIECLWSGPQCDLLGGPRLMHLLGSTHMVPRSNSSIPFLNIFTRDIILRHYIAWNNLIGNSLNKLGYISFDCY